MNNEKKVEEGLSFKDILQIIKKHIIVILACVIGFSILGYVFSKVKGPEYSAKSTLLVQYEGGDSGTVITTEYSFSKSISDTLAVFIKENVVMQKVVDKARTSGLYAEEEAKEDYLLINAIKRNISISNDALILTVTYKDTDPERAKNITNYIVEAAQEVADSVDNEGTANYYLLKDNIRVLSPATRANVESSTIKNVAIFFAIGCVIAFIYVLFRELFDKSFKSGEDIESTLGIPVIATIPDYDMDAIVEGRDGGK